MRILVVDDEEHLRRVMRLTLEASGYDVTEAPDGETGLELFGDGLTFDATLIDQRLPGMDGLETLRRMKERRADACIIMVTAYATIELAVDAMKLGASDFVRKPMTPDTLRQSVQAALAKRDRTAAAVPGAPPAPSASAAGQLPPPVEIWTTNGFFVHRLDRVPAWNAQAAEHRFIVRRGKEVAGAEVVVTIDPKLVQRLARMCQKELSPAGAFWRRQAERTLVNYLWSEAELPRGGWLVVGTLTGSMVDAAWSWPDDQRGAGDAVGGSGPSSTASPDPDA
jgi:DNA-binding response OmpR family regulator